MITKIELSNFKCFRRLELKCAPLTLLCGLNGMGKKRCHPSAASPFGSRLNREAYLTGS